MLLQVDGIRVAYGGIEALRGVSFDVDEGEIVALLGANGAGKTTTLRTVSGLLRPKTGTIIFSGTMSYAPNVHAAQWFADECFPRVREAVPDASFVIAGAAPRRSLRRLGRRPGVTVTGFVESMAETLNRATVAVAPMISGAGIQNKVLEALAMAKAHPNIDVRMATTFTGFTQGADAVIARITNEAGETEAIVDPDLEVAILNCLQPKLRR